MPKKQVPSLSEWMGGFPKIEPLIKRFYEKVLQDELLIPLFAHISPEHPTHVAQFITEVFQGPPLYTTERKGSHALMISHHLDKHLTEAQRKRWMNLLLETADEARVPMDAEFRSALVAYLEWGSRIAVTNSHTKINPVDDLEPMPRWGWGEPGGPYLPGAATPDAARADAAGPGAATP